MVNTPIAKEPPAEVIQDIALTALADHYGIPPNKIEKTFSLSSKGIADISRQFHKSFEKHIYGFDAGILYWYLIDAYSVETIVSSVQSYIEELLRT